MSQKVRAAGESSPRRRAIAISAFGTLPLKGGRAHPTVTKAGLHIKIPFIQEVRRFEKRLLIWDEAPNQIPTRGREFVWIDTTAHWRIADARVLLENVASESGARSRLGDIIDSVVRDQVSGSELGELVRSSSWSVPKGEVLEEELSQIRATAYRQVQEIRSKADAEATRIYGDAYNRDPEFYAFSPTLEAYKEGQNKNSVMILTTDSDHHRHLKKSGVPNNRRIGE